MDRELTRKGAFRLVSHLTGMTSGFPVFFCGSQAIVLLVSDDTSQRAGVCITPASAQVSCPAPDFTCQCGMQNL